MQCSASSHAACTAASGKPVCAATANTCVQCTANDKVACTGNTPVCDANTNTCVECNTNTECPSATKSLCANHICTACAHDADCSLIAGKNVCASGECVQCTAANETKCAGDSCNPATKTCTTTPVASKNVCESCAADSECKANYRCVPLFFQGNAHGSYCMKRLATGCSQPYGFTPSFQRTSVSGSPEEKYCSIDETKTSCETILGLVTGKTCPGNTDAECGSSGALCRTIGGLTPNRCTYGCGSSNSCTSDTACGTAPNDYCGGQ